jgi:hypothetical protein
LGTGYRDLRVKVSSSPHLGTETDPVSETLDFLVFIIPDDEQSPETKLFEFKK